MKREEGAGDAKEWRQDKILIKPQTFIAAVAVFIQYRERGAGSRIREVLGKLSLVLRARAFVGSAGFRF